MNDHENPWVNDRENPQNFSGSVPTCNLVLHEYAGVEISSVANAVRSYAINLQSVPGHSTDAVTSGTSSITSSAGDVIMAVASDDPVSNWGGDYDAGTNFTLREQNNIAGFFGSEDNLTNSLTAATFTDNSATTVQVYTGAIVLKPASP